MTASLLSPTDPKSVDFGDDVRSYQEVGGDEMAGPSQNDMRILNEYGDSRSRNEVDSVFLK